MARSGRVFCLGLVVALVMAVSAAQGQDATDEFALDENEASSDHLGEQENTLLSDEQALAEEEASEGDFRKSTDPYEDPDKRYFFAGVNWRYLRMPDWILEWGLEAAPGIGSAGSFFGEFAYRKDGFQIAADVGWIKFHMKGPFQLSGDPPEDTEWMDGPFNLLVTSATFTWSTSFTKWLSLDYGVEAGLLFVFGDLVRSEAYQRSSDGAWQRCPGWVDPLNPTSATRPGQVAATDPNQVRFCAPPIDYTGGGTPATNETDEEGEHYGVKAKRGLFNKGVPNVLPVIGPRVSLRVKPIAQLVLRVDVPLPVFPFGFMGGIAALYGF